MKDERIIGDVGFATRVRVLYWQRACLPLWPSRNSNEKTIDDVSFAARIELHH